jgi:hypothetical protein
MTYTSLGHLMAEPTGLEPATSDVTGRRSNQLNYDSAKPLPIFDFRLPIDKHLTDSRIGNWKLAISNVLVGAEGLEPPTSSL